MSDESNNQQDKKKQKPTFPNMVFPSASEVESEYFGGSAPEKVSMDDVKKAKEEQKNENPENEKQENKEQKQNEKTDKNQSENKEQNSEQKQDNTNQQQNPYKENSIKSLKDLGFNTQDDKKFFRKIKQFEVQIEIP